MRKFTENIQNNNEIFEDKQLELGLNIEKEHNDIYEYLDKYFKDNNIANPLSERDFYEMIAKAHIKEIPDYYTRLMVVEHE